MAAGEKALPASPAAAVRARSTQVLGGYVDGRAGINFVPAFSAFAVDHAYRVSGHTTLPSYRSYWLKRLSSEQGWLVTHLRESNVLTTRLEHDRGDDLFLFFTDDTIALRPLYGAANVLVDAGGTAAGLLTLPFDRGALLISAARSLVFSMPELVFANLRKGRNRTLPRAWTEDVALAARTPANERHAN